MIAPIISKNIRVRHPENFVVGEGSIVDDFSYFSTKVVIGKCTHIASGCSIAGGEERLCSIGDFCSLSSGVKIWCTSDDFTKDIVTIIPPGLPQVKEHVISGDVTFDSMTAVGANSVVMPSNHLPEGTVIGALSYVPSAYAFEPWMVYAGIPLRPIRPRDKDAVLRQRDALLRAMASSSAARQP